jgi:hypothetical protein
LMRRTGKSLESWIFLTDCFHWLLARERLPSTATLISLV